MLNLKIKVPKSDLNRKYPQWSTITHNKREKSKCSEFRKNLHQEVKLDAESKNEGLKVRSQLQTLRIWSWYGEISTLWAHPFISKLNFVFKLSILFLRRCHKVWHLWHLPNHDETNDRNLNWERKESYFKHNTTFVNEITI